ncbi:MAG: hypothetical protein IKS51_01410 [Erysipelotrichaceae bacterium]|nr:hypothetical protein [Erysipelotrichaceae bacterium]
MKKNRTETTMREKAMRTILFILLFLVLVSCAGKESSSSKKETVKPNPIENKPNKEENSPSSFKNDPLSLSFRNSNYYTESELRNKLALSELEYCSYLIEGEGPADYVLTWNLKSSGKEVYRCEYSYDKNRSYKVKSQAACELSEGYEDYRDGDRELIREYVMPQENDQIDMFVYENSSGYYEDYFILGKYSDMSCYIKGEDIYFEYSWYQRTEDGPVLVYKSTAKNTDTTWGERYNETLWRLFEESYKNIDIVPYEEYQRDRDYYEVYHQWENREQEKQAEESLKEMIEIYCACGDEDELYSEYEDDFDSWTEAEDFWERYCE